MKTKLLFIHRSVGHHLIEQGHLRELLHDKGISFDDFDNNSGLLTRDNLEATQGTIAMPGNNTNPENLAEFFTSWPDVLDGYNVIMIKSCYPNSHIKDETQLSKIKEDYRTIFKTAEAHHKPFVVLTSPPLRPLSTNKIEARLAIKLADWLVSSAQVNSHVFDFHHLLAEPTGKHEGMLKRNYQRLIPFDNHPDRKANKDIAPLLVNQLQIWLEKTLT